MKRDHGWRPSAYEQEDHDRFEVLSHRTLQNQSVLHRGRKVKGFSRDVPTRKHTPGESTVGDGVYDAVILCTGYTFDRSPFVHAQSKLQWRPEQMRVQYPPCLEFERTTSRGISKAYSLQALSHSRDFLRGAGGTLQGYGTHQGTLQHFAGQRARHAVQ